MAAPDLNLNSDFLAQADWTTAATTTGDQAAAAGLTTVAVRIAATPTGSALGTLTGTAAERSGTSGRYYYVFDQAALQSALATYVGYSVWLIWSKSGDTDDLVKEFTVRDHVAVS